MPELVENYPGNSRHVRQKEEKPAKDVKTLVTEPIERRKKGLGRKFIETFFGGDGAQSVWGYVIHDVLIPAAKDAVSDAVTQGFDRMLFGEVRGYRGRRGSSAIRDGAPYVSYNRYAPSGGRRDDPPRREQLSSRARSNHQFDEIVFGTRVEAEEVFQQLFNIVESYDSVSVADFYKSVGEIPTFTDEQWGWTDLRDARVLKVKGGYLIDLPATEKIN